MSAHELQRARKRYLFTYSGCISVVEVDAKNNQINLMKEDSK